MAELGKIAAVDGLYELRITRRFEATPAEVWSALTEPERLRRWLGTVTYDAAPGSHFRIDFEGGDAVSGEVVEFDPPRVFAFTWREGTGDAGPSIVRFELAEEVRATTLVLTHTRQPAGLARGTVSGWHAHVDLLDGYLQGVALEWDKVYPPVKALYASAVESIVD